MNEEHNIMQLPKDWKWVKLGEVCEKVETVKRKEKDPGSEFLYLDIGGIDNLSNKICCKYDNIRLLYVTKQLQKENLANKLYYSILSG